MNTQKVLIIVVILVLLVLGVTFPRGNTVIERITTELGAAAGPDMSGPYLSVGGVATWSEKQVMKTATSTLCSFKSPSATSTLTHLSAIFSTTASYATSYAFGNAATEFSTTTIIVAPYSFAASATGEIVASTTKITAFTQNGVVSPNTYINLKLSTTTAGASATYAPKGVCEVQFVTLN